MTKINRTPIKMKVSDGAAEPLSYNPIWSMNVFNEPPQVTFDSQSSSPLESICGSEGSLFIQSLNHSLTLPIISFNPHAFEG